MHPLSLLICSQASDTKNKLKLRLSKFTAISKFQYFFANKNAVSKKNSRYHNVKNLDERRRKIFKGKILEIYEQVPAFLGGDRFQTHQVRADLRFFGRCANCDEVF